MRPAFVAMLIGVLALAGCASPSYLSVPPADPPGHDVRLAPSRPEQAVTREQHLGQLREDVRFQEEALLRAEQDRLLACRAPMLLTQVQSLTSVASSRTRSTNDSNARQPSPENVTCGLSAVRVA